MPRAGAPAAEEVVKHNSSCFVPKGQKLEELHFFPGLDKLQSLFFTFEGRRRCGDCGQLWSINHHSCPSILPTVVSSFCDQCGMPFPGGQAGIKLKSRHRKRCWGECVRAGWQPASDGTLHCPLCKAPGFNYESLEAHLTKEGKACDGNRKSKRYDGEKQYTGTGWKVFCQGCEYTFHAMHPFARHVCGSPHDPIWLGKTTHPNTSKPYVVWCHEDASPDIPVGYGGGQIAGDGDGAIPDAVRDASWLIPFSTYMQPDPDTVAQYFEDIRSLNDLVRRRLMRGYAGVVDEDDDDDEEEDDNHIAEDDRPLVADGLSQYFEDLSATLDAELKDVPEDQALAVKHERVRHEQAREMKKRNLFVLERGNISVHTFQSHQCLGYSFTHGHIPCPYGAMLDLGSVRMISCLEWPDVKWSPVCFRCHKRAQRLHRWQNRCKYNADGNRMCTVNNCRNPLADSIDCEEHAQARLERRLAAARQRVNRPQQRVRPWKIVSPADMRRWVSGLDSIRASWGNHPVWAGVSRALKAGPGGAKAVYFVDTESLIAGAPEDQPREPVVLELAVVDASGVAKIDTTLQHGDKTISEICAGLQEQFVAYACRLYGVPDTTHKTKGMPLDVAKSELASLKLGDSLMVEWSMNGWDWRALRHMFGEHSVPETYLRGIDLLRMAGYCGPMDFATLFYLLFPDSPLCRRHHRALVDAQKLLLVLNYILMGGQALMLDMGGDEV